MVTNGIYATGEEPFKAPMPNRVAVDKRLRLQSVNGPQFTIIKGHQVPGTTNGNAPSDASISPTARVCPGSRDQWRNSD